MSQYTDGLVRGSLSALPRYQPGRALGAAADTGRPSFKLSSNENPFPPIEPVIAAIRSVMQQTNRYPDMFAAELVEALAQHHHVAADRIAVGTGSVGVLGQIVAAVCDAGDEVVTAWRSFEAYPIVTAIAGAVAVQVPLAPLGRHDLPAMLAAVTSRTKLLILCTPNNPTGPALHHDQVVALLEALPPHVLVVIDEAYVEFVRDPLAVDGPALVAQHENVVVLRTFSKAHGLAALRVGYALADAGIAGALRATAVPFGVSAAAQAAAVAALGAGHLLAPQIDSIVAERERVCEALFAQGWRIPAADGNFVWFPVGVCSGEFVTACAERGVAVRDFAGDGVRVTIGEPEANDIVLDVAAQDTWRALHGA